MKPKREWERVIRDNVIYDEAELGSPWDIDDLIEYVSQLLEKQVEEIWKEVEKASDWLWEKQKRTPYMIPMGIIRDILVKNGLKDKLNQTKE